MAALTELLGKRLKGDGDTETATALEGKAAVALYFADTSEAATAFTATLSKAYEEALGDKGLEVILIPCIDSEEEADGVFAEMPWLMLPFDCRTEQEALVEKFQVSAPPKLVILDMEAQLITDDGMSKVAEDPQGENFPWQTPVLTEQDILVRMGPVPPEPGESGIKGIFINSKNYVSLGFVDQAEEDDDVPFSGMKLKPYVEKSRQQALDEVKKMGFASDFHQQHKEIDKFPGEWLLMIFDQDKAYGEKIVWCNTMDAYNREKERIQSLRDEIVQQFEASLRPASGGAGGEVAAEDEQEENIVVRDEPKDCGEWKSETMEVTHKEVVNFTVLNSRPKMQLLIMRPRHQFGRPFKFIDSGDHPPTHVRPQKDPNFALQRKELELGIQAVKEVRTVSCQTTWYRPVNKSTQYSPNDFLPKQTDAGYDKVDELTEFLSAVSVGVEEALQTNETVDIFQEEFAHLGEAEAGASSDANSAIKELRAFSDVRYTKGKRIECVDWVPGSTDMLACSCCESLAFIERLENAGKATESTILIWSFQDNLQPHAKLISPWEVPVFKFYPSDEKFLVAGLSSGQVAVWKLSDADLGHAAREKGKGAQEDERSSSTLEKEVPHKQISFIDESHRKPVVAIEWLPATIEIEKRGRGASEKHPKDSPVKYFITIAGDGQVLLWNFQEVLDSLNDADFWWQPLLKVQLQRQDSGTEMGCCHLLYCHDRHDDKGKHLTNFYASTEEGELILGDWAARGEEDRKAEFVKRRLAVSKTFRPMLSLERSPFFSDILLGVTDWAFFLWKDGVQEHLFQSSYTSTYFTCGVWSPTRPSVIFLGLNSGGIDIWDFSDQSHKAAVNDTGASVPITSMVFRKTGDRDAISEQWLAIGDAQGQLHVLLVPKNLVRQAGKEKDTMGRFLEREEARVKYFEERRHRLGDLKEKMEKEEQMAADKEAAEKEKSAADQGALDKASEAMYQKLEIEVREQLGLPLKG